MATSIPRAFAGRHEPRPLPFHPAKLRGLSERLLRSHWEKNYRGAVKALNVVEQRLAAMQRWKGQRRHVVHDLDARVSTG